MSNIEITSDELAGLLGRVQPNVEPKDYELIKAIIQSYQETYALLQEKNISIKKLKAIIFGTKTEKKNPAPLPPDNKKETSSLDQPETNHGNEPTTKTETDADAETETETEKKTEISPEKNSKNEGEIPKPNKKKKAGHGHLGASDYTGADICCIKHDSLSPGDLCPICNKAKLYAKPPLVFVKISGQAPLGATVYKIDSLRCALCGEVFNASKPQMDRFDPSAVAMIAQLKYGTGMPFHRLENMQSSLGIPLPESTQWDAIQSQIHVFRALYLSLICTAAAAELIYIDDTPAKILESMGKRLEKNVEKHGEPDHRKGMFATGVIACPQNKPVVTLYFTGHKHAGENLTRVLEKRSPLLPPPILMCDALSRNTPFQLVLLLARCFAHARRKFQEIQNDYPLHCHKILTIMSYIYNIDRLSKIQKMSDQERLINHQLFSGPAIRQLEKIFKDLIDAKVVQPNSSLGKAIAYCHNHWTGLTLFLREPGAPLDNNICEQALKLFILNRKNAYFYRSLKGAEAGDIFMSLIKTCNINKINPVEYLTKVLENKELVLKNPSEWMPWNYTDAMTVKKMII